MATATTSVGTGRAAQVVATTVAESAALGRDSRTLRTRTTTTYPISQPAPNRRYSRIPTTDEIGPASAYPAGRNTIAPIQAYAETRAILSGAIIRWTVVSQTTEPAANAKPASAAAGASSSTGA